MKQLIIGVIITVFSLFSCGGEDNKDGSNETKEKVVNYFNSKYFSESEIELLFSNGIDISLLEQKLLGMGLFINFETDSFIGTIDLFTNLGRPFELNMYGNYEIINKEYAVTRNVLYLSFVIEKEFVNEKKVIKLSFQITPETLISLLKKFFHSYKYAPELVDSYQIQSIELIRGSIESVDN